MQQVIRHFQSTIQPADGILVASELFVVPPNQPVVLAINELFLVQAVVHGDLVVNTEAWEANEVQGAVAHHGTGLVHIVSMSHDITNVTCSKQQTMSE